MCPSSAHCKLLISMFFGQYNLMLSTMWTFNFLCIHTCSLQGRGRGNACTSSDKSEMHNVTSRPMLVCHKQGRLASIFFCELRHEHHEFGLFWIWQDSFLAGPYEHQPWMMMLILCCWCFRSDVFRISPYFTLAVGVKLCRTWQKSYADGGFILWILMDCFVPVR